MRRVAGSLMALAGILLVAAPALAWEFRMSGEFEYRVCYFSRIGEKDLFGNASLQETGAGTFIGFAGPNIWGTGNSVSVPASNPLPLALGGADVKITRGGFSRYASDAMLNDMRVTLFPSVDVNPAIHLAGVLNIGGVRNEYAQRDKLVTDLHDPVGTPPYERYYPITTSTSARNTAALLSIEQFEARLLLPWCIITFGVKDLPGGPGATYGHAVRGELFTVVVPYGPLRLILGLWPGLGLDLSEAGWDNSPGKDQKNDLFLVTALTYENASMRIIGATFIRKFHGVHQVKVQGMPIGLELPGDTDDLISVLSLQYSNGRFFSNLDYASRTSSTYHLGFRPRYTDAYHFFSESGVLMGPAKLSLVYAVASGLVLNGGNPTKEYLPWPINYEAMEPYEWLMFYTYGGGNRMFTGFFVQDGAGMLGDAYSFAGRLDYSVAANLNIWGSYIWAHRLERAGTLAGQFNETGSLTPPGPFFMGNYGGTTWYPPDGYIGWEANLGLDWKLLDGVTYRTRYAYWQPGAWFDYAYQAIDRRGGFIVRDAIMHGRDPIHALKVSLVVDF